MSLDVPPGPHALADCKVQFPPNISSTEKFVDGVPSAIHFAAGIQARDYPAFAPGFTGGGAAELALPEGIAGHAEPCG